MQFVKNSLKVKEQMWKLGDLRFSFRLPHLKTKCKNTSMKTDSEDPNSSSIYKFVNIISKNLYIFVGIVIQNVYIFVTIVTIEREIAAGG